MAGGAEVANATAASPSIERSVVLIRLDVGNVALSRYKLWAAGQHRDGKTEEHKEGYGASHAPRI